MENTIQTLNSKNESEMELYRLSKRFFKLILILFCGYALGYLGFSLLWLLIGVFVWTLRNKYSKELSDKVNLQRFIASNEKLAITCAMKDLPSWVYFPVCISKLANALSFSTAFVLKPKVLFLIN
jgi:hypothetical protein